MNWEQRQKLVDVLHNVNEPDDTLIPLVYDTYDELYRLTKLVSNYKAVLRDCLQ